MSLGNILVTEHQIYDNVFHSSIAHDLEKQEENGFVVFKKSRWVLKLDIKLGIQYKVQELDDDCHITL